MNPVQILEKKRDGKKLTQQEIHWLIDQVAKQKLPDYQASAFLMAVATKGMDETETAHLTQSMVSTGLTVDLDSIQGPKIDKHSTGGVGDKVSIPLAPLVASCGVVVPMMAGRGLGFTGGTIDKLESIPGFKTYLDPTAFAKQLKKIGCAIIAQNPQVAPADKKLYSLRDVTGTIPSVPLITASILSKKIAEGATGLVLDLKVGTGAFMKTKKDATALANSIRKTGRKLGLNTKVYLTSMNQPLGWASGNLIEIEESLQVLRGTQPQESSELRSLTLDLAAEMILMAKKAKDFKTARVLAETNLTNGSAYTKFVEMCVAQGADKSFFEKDSVYSKQKTEILVKAPRAGFISGFDTELIGNTLVDLGAGRRTLTDSVDPLVGIKTHVKIGQKVAKNETLFTIYSTKSVDSLFVSNLTKSVFLTGKKARADKLILHRG